ncbi:MAG: protein translocase subunit SecF [Candidatus Sungbacteria bacterium]|nr:protein translocase subunit SecF [Candidatus Sungbacteria bacterium]
MNVIERKYIFLTISGLLVAGGLIVFGFWGLKQGIDFTGGSLLEIAFVPKDPDAIIPTAESLQHSLTSFELGSALIQSSGDTSVIMRFRHIDEPTHQEILRRIVATAGPRLEVTEKQFTTIGPTIGAELRRRALLALALATLGIVLYIAWAFRHVSRPLPSWKYGVVAITTLVHDVAIPTGLFALLGHVKGVEVDSLFLTALLTIMGFSVHDTIVVFDRTRENLRKTKGGEPYGVTVNRSINETFARSINTSLTVLLVLAAIVFVGGAAVRYFALALIVGITFGTYSSIFVASPLLVVWERLGARKKGKQTQ